jgi:hypothetical protein
MTSASITSAVTDLVSSNNSVSLTTNIPLVTPGGYSDVEIPTMPEWGIIIMSLLLTGMAIRMQRRNRAA